MIAWCKCSRVIKDLPIWGSFFLINLPKYLGTKLFYSLYANVTHFLKNIPLKKPVKLKRFLCKDTSSQNFLKSLVYVNVSTLQISYLTKFQSQLMAQFYKKRVNRDDGVLEHQICFVIGKNLRKQELPENFSAAHSRKRKPILRFMKP